MAQSIQCQVLISLRAGLNCYLSKIQKLFWVLKNKKKVLKSFERLVKLSVLIILPSPLRKYTAFVTLRICHQTQQPDSFARSGLTFSWTWCHILLSSSTESDTGGAWQVRVLVFPRTHGCELPQKYACLHLRGSGVIQKIRQPFIEKHYSSNTVWSRAGELANHVWNKPENLLGTFSRRKKTMEPDPLRKIKLQTPQKIKPGTNRKRQSPLTHSSLHLICHFRCLILQLTEVCSLISVNKIRRSR